MSFESNKQVASCSGLDVRDRFAMFMKIGFDPRFRGQYPAWRDSSRSRRKESSKPLMQITDTDLELRSIHDVSNGSRDGTLTKEIFQVFSGLVPRKERWTCLNKVPLPLYIPEDAITIINRFGTLLEVITQANYISHEELS